MPASTARSIPGRTSCPPRTIRSLLIEITGATGSVNQRRIRLEAWSQFFVPRTYGRRPAFVLELALVLEFEQLCPLAGTLGFFSVPPATRRPGL